MMTPKPVVLCILDGWGLRDDPIGNAPLLANTPNFDAIMRGPHAQLLTHGNDAGLPTGQMALAGSRYDAVSGISEMQHALAPVDTVSTDKVQKHKNPLPQS